MSTLIKCAAEVQLSTTEYDNLQAWVDIELAKPEKTIPQSVQDLVLRALHFGNYNRRFIECDERNE